MKALVGAYNKEKALVGAFSGNCETSRRFIDSYRTNLPLGGIDPSGRLFISFIVLPIFANFLELLESKRQSLLLSSANSLNLSFINIEMGKFSNKILKFLSFLFQFWGKWSVSEFTKSNCSYIYNNIKVEVEITRIYLIYQRFKAKHKLDLCSLPSIYLSCYFDWLTINFIRWKRLVPQIG